MADWPGDIKEQIECSRDSKLRLRQRADQSLLFLEGEQWIKWDPRRAGYDFTAAPDDRPRITVNLLLGPYRNLFARLAVEMPGYTVVPTTEATDDLAKALSAEGILAYHWQKQELESIYDELICWAFACGTAARHDYWEDGEVKSEAYGFYDIFVEEGATKEEESEWVALRSWPTRAALMAKYPEKKRKIKKLHRGGEENDRPIDRANQSVVTGEDSKKGEYSKDKQLERMETFTIYWHDGRKAVVCDGEYLEQGETGLPSIPVEIVRWTTIPGAFWGLSGVHPSVHLQWLYNTSRALIIENIDKMGNPVWQAPVGCGVPLGSFNNQIGNVIEYNPALPAPQQVKPVELPQHVMQHPSQLAAEIQDTSLIHSTTTGKRAAGITAARAMSQLTENDTVQLEMTRKSFIRATKRGSKTVLELYKKHLTRKKAVGMLDLFGNVVFEELKGTDIPTEVHIHPHSLFKVDAETRDQKTFAELQMGLITPEDAKKRLSTRAITSDAFRRVVQLSHAQQIVKTIEGYDKMAGVAEQKVQQMLGGGLPMWQVPRQHQPLVMATQMGEMSPDDALNQLMPEYLPKAEVMPTDDPDVLVDTLGDFIRSAKFYHLSPLAQEYAKDIYDQAVISQQQERMQQARLFDPNQMAQIQQPGPPGRTGTADEMGQPVQSNPGPGSLADGSAPGAEALSGIGGLR